jgi:hypothetical protein
MSVSLAERFRRHELYVVSAVIGVVFVGAVALVAWVLRTSVTAQPYESLGNTELEKVFATAYLRHREDDGTPYLKVEIHNGTLWWIKKVEFDFEGRRYTLSDAHAFRPLHFAAMRCLLQKTPSSEAAREFDLKIVSALGHPPADTRAFADSGRVAADPAGRTPGF